MKWELAYILPNVLPKNSYECDGIAMVPNNDDRIKMIIANDELAQKLYSCISDRNGNQVEPAAIIYNQKTKLRVGGAAEYIVRFRNIVAITIILKTRSITGPRVPSLYYSDHLDLFPVTIGQSSLITSTPGVKQLYIGGVKPKGFTNPALPPQVSTNYPIDWATYYGLINIFNANEYSMNYHVDQVFRALEVAYYAASMFFKNLASVYDFAFAAAIWVSAYETLLHPDGEFVGENDVLSFIKKYRWDDAYLNANYFNIKYTRHNRYEKGNAIQKCVNIIYSLRNDFLHGNPIQFNLLGYIKIAPLIFRILLFQFLEDKCQVELELLFEHSHGQFNSSILWIENQVHFEKPLLNMFGR